LQIAAFSSYHIVIMNKILEFAIDLAFESGKIQKDHFDKIHTIRHKGEIDIVTEVDMKCQERIMEMIGNRYPKDLIISEEKENVFHGTGNRWIIDPVDGTTNYAHGYPFFCTSIAYEHNGKITCGVVYNPIFDELFCARTGSGSYLNGNPLRVSDVDHMRQALLVTGFPYDVSTNPENNIDHFVAFLHKAQAVRRDGSAALNLCYVAAGRFDGYWELKLNPWDTAAGALIAQEAGGKVTAFDGTPFDIYKGRVVASNGIIHDEILRTLNGQIG
jgi:myo-inositol-1(or 4)-monophosphatase